MKKVFGYIVAPKIAKKRTCWWCNDWKPDSHGYRPRTDALVSVQRVYARSMRLYAYQLIIGRFQVTVAKIDQ